MYTFAILIFALSSLVSFTTADIYQYPQYLAVNFDFDPGVPASFYPQTVAAMLAAVNQTRGSDKRILSLSFDFWTLYDGDIPTMLNSTDALLSLVEQFDLPLTISIDATQWWQYRPDLWNWWNTSFAGYNPENRMNVEWTAPTPANATSISWRNWGSQFRMPSPAPNFLSPAYQQAAAESMIPIAQRIAQWYISLPPNKKYLLGYIRCVQELWEGTNYFYYPGANLPNGTPAWLPDKDPMTGVAGSVQLGYAALCTSQVLCNGTITTAQLDLIISTFITFAGQVLIDAGIPRSRIMSHTGSFFSNPPTKTIAFNSAAAAITTTTAPGWSIYNEAAVNISNNLGIPEALESVKNTPWGAPEFNPFLGTKGTVDSWKNAFLNTFGYKNNRLIVLQNWNSIYPSNPIGQEGLVQALLDIPDCLVDAAYNFSVTMINSTTLELQFILGPDTDNANLYISVVNNIFLPSGEIATPSLTIPLTPAMNSYLLNLNEVGNGLIPIYWQISSTGCNDSQMINSEVQIINVNTT